MKTKTISKPLVVAKFLMVMFALFASTLAIRAAIECSAFGGGAEFAEVLLAHSVLFGAILFMFCVALLLS